MKKYAVIVAGGSGSRMGSSLPKQFMLLNNKPVLWYTLTTFLSAFADLQIILVLPIDYVNTGQGIAASTHDASRIQVVPGGSTRFHSVKNGLEHVADNAIVFIHDGVRCLISTRLIQSCYRVAVEKGNAIPAILATDSIRMGNLDNNQAIDRTQVHIIQTPQTFQVGIIKKAYQSAYQDMFTDEASVAEYAGIKIQLVEGEASNIKITRPIDLVLAGAILQERTEH